MSRNLPKILLLALMMVLLIAQTSGISFAQEQDQNQPAPEWPRKFAGNIGTFSVYQPQVDTWKDNQLTAYAAVEVTGAGSKDVTYGVVFFSARTEIDKVNREVTLQDFKITKAKFPTANDGGTEYAAALQKFIPTEPTIPLDHLEADLNLTKAEVEANSHPLKNDPPKIIFSTKPAVLVLIDGEPALRPVPKNKELQRIINTRSLILFDVKKSFYYLQVMDGFMESPAVTGPWTVCKKPPKHADKIQKQLVDSHLISLIDAGKQLSNGAPVIYVATEPTELLQTTGDPQYSPIPETELLYVTNTKGNIFRYIGDQKIYILISGRWFSSITENGPWNFVAASALPKDFAKIPPDSAKASVLVSVPGTPQAKEALIENQIPQTATITRSTAHATVSYDGSPKFSDIKETSLKYATNTETPVIEVNTNSYYAVQNGVWFESPSAVGPWAVATSVPGVIYTIPTNSPLHYVTYVKVYGYTDSVVYVGYTPGYYGTVVSSDNVVVYGTGYYYPSYVGADVWYGTPYTYGVGAGFYWGAAVGWSMAFGIGYSSICYPWWGPVGYYGYYGGWAPAYGWGAYGGAMATNVYGHWGNTAFQGTRAAWANPYTGNYGTAARGRTYNPVTGGESIGREGRNTNVYTGRQEGAAGGVHYNSRTGVISGGRVGYSGNMYSGNYEVGGKGFAYDTRTGQGVKGSGLYGDHDGNVWRQGGTGWQSYDRSGWHDSGSRDLSHLNNSAHSRQFGGFRSGGFSGFRGGGFRGGFRR